MERIRVILGVAVVKVEIGFDPPLDPSRVAQAAKLQLGLL
jgi:metal-sulfur cluster biosynthetic enzyme